MKSRVLLITLLTAGLPMLAEAQGFGAPRTFRELAVDIVDLLSAATGVALALAVTIFIWNIASNVRTYSKDGIKAYKATIVWGTIALFVMVSIWGILGILRNTLFQGDSGGAYMLESLSHIV